MKQFALRRLDVSPAVLSLRLLLESERHYRQPPSGICFNVHAINKTTRACFYHCLCVSINWLGELNDWNASSWHCSFLQQNVALTCWSKSSWLCLTFEIPCKSDLSEPLLFRQVRKPCRNIMKSWNFQFASDFHRPPEVIRR